MVAKADIAVFDSISHLRLFCRISRYGEYLLSRARFGTGEESKSNKHAIYVPIITVSSF